MDGTGSNHNRRAFAASLAASLAALALPPAARAAPPKVALYLPFPEGSLRGAAHLRAIGRISAEAPGGADLQENWGVPHGEIGSRLARLAYERYAGVFLLSPGYHAPAEAALRQIKDPPYVTVLAEVGRPGRASAYGIRMYEGFHLAGMLAGFASRSGRAGLVSTVPTAETVRNINAFALGMRARNPQAQVFAFFIGKASDPDTERAVVNGMVRRRGVDLLVHDTDGDTVPRLADLNGAWSIPLRIAEETPLGAKTLVRVRPDWEGPYRIQLNRAINGGEPRFSWHGLRERAIGLHGHHHLLPVRVIGEVGDVARRIAAREAHPFQGPIRASDGRPVVAEGDRLTDRDLVRMDYFVEGVVRLRERGAATGGDGG